MTTFGGDMRLSKLLEEAGIAAAGELTDAEITEIVTDSNGLAGIS